MSLWCISVKTVGLNRALPNQSTSSPNTPNDNTSSPSSSSSSSEATASSSSSEAASKPQPTNFNISISPDDSLASLYHQISDITGLQIQQQRLIYRGRLIHDPSSSSTTNSSTNSNGNNNNNSNEDGQGGQGGENELSSSLEKIKIRDVDGLADGQTIHLVPKLLPPSTPTSDTNNNNNINSNNNNSNGSNASNGNSTFNNSPSGNGGGNIFAALLGLADDDDDESNNNNNNNSTSTTTTTTNTTEEGGMGITTRRRNTQALHTTTSSNNNSSLNSRPSHRRSQGDPLYPQPSSLEPIRQGLLTLHTILDSTHDGATTDANTSAPTTSTTSTSTCTNTCTNTSTPTTITTTTTPIPPKVINPSPLTRQRKWYKGQLIDLKDTVNQWLEATIVEILYPHDCLTFPTSTPNDTTTTTTSNSDATTDAPEYSFNSSSTTTTSRPRIYNDTAIGANDHIGRNFLLLEKCAPPLSTTTTTTDNNNGTIQETIIEENNTTATASTIHPTNPDTTTTPSNNANITIPEPTTPYETYTTKLAHLNNDPSLIGYTSRPNNQNVQLLLVHYNGWPHRWDEWIRSDSDRIRPFRTRSRHFVGLAPSSHGTSAGSGNHNNGGGGNGVGGGGGMRMVARRGMGSAGTMMNGGMTMSPFPQSVFDAAPDTFLERNVNGLEEDDEDEEDDAEEDDGEEEEEGEGLDDSYEDDEDDDEEDGEQDGEERDDTTGNATSTTSGVNWTMLSSTEQRSSRRGGVGRRIRNKHVTKVEDTITIERMAIMKEVLRKLDSVSSLLHSALGEDELKLLQQQRQQQQSMQLHGSNMGGMKEEEIMEDECKMPAIPSPVKDGNNEPNTPRELPWLPPTTTTISTSTTYSASYPTKEELEPLNQGDTTNATTTATAAATTTTTKESTSSPSSDYEYLTHKTNKIDVQKMEALGPIMDRLGRVLIDFAPHVAEASKHIKSNKEKEYNYQQLSNIGDTQEVKEENQRKRSAEDDVAAEGSTTNDESANDNTTSIEQEDRPASAESNILGQRNNNSNIETQQQEEIIDPDHVDFINGFINVSRDNPSGRRHAIRRSSSDASLGSSLLSTYLATAANNATAAILENEDGAGRNGNTNRAAAMFMGSDDGNGTPRVVRFGGNNPGAGGSGGGGGGSAGSGSAGGGGTGPGGIDIHIHAIVTGPNGTGMGNLGLDGLAGLLGDAGPTIIGGAMGAIPPPPISTTTEDAPGSATTSASSASRNANAAGTTQSGLDEDDDEMGLFSDLYSDLPTPLTTTATTLNASDESEIHDDGGEDGPSASTTTPAASTNSNAEDSSRSSNINQPPPRQNNNSRPNTSTSTRTFASQSSADSIPILESNSNISVASNTSSSTNRTTRSENERRNAFLSRLFRRANRRSNDGNNN